MTGPTGQTSGTKADDPQLTDEDRSKDRFFNEIAALSNSMITAHGREFAMGALILAARFIAENKAFSKQSETAAYCGGACQSSDNPNHDHHHHKG